MSNCLFCRIVSGEIPSKMVYQDEQCMAFDDVNPQAPVHVLVIPRAHVESLQGFQTSETNLMGALLQGCREVAQLKGVSDSGYRVVANTGSSAGQTVFHMHFHVLGGRSFAWPPG